MSIKVRLDTRVPERFVVVVSQDPGTDLWRYVCPTHGVSEGAWHDDASASDQAVTHLQRGH
jgi:hypothetical protein